MVDDDRDPGAEQRRHDRLQVLRLAMHLDLPAEAGDALQERRPRRLVEARDRQPDEVEADADDALAVELGELLLRRRRLDHRDAAQARRRCAEPFEQEPVVGAEEARLDEHPARHAVLVEDPQVIRDRRVVVRRIAAHVGKLQPAFEDVGVTIGRRAALSQRREGRAGGGREQPGRYRPAGGFCIIVRQIARHDGCPRVFNSGIVVEPRRERNRGIRGTLSLADRASASASSRKDDRRWLPRGRGRVRIRDVSEARLKAYQQPLIPGRAATRSPRRRGEKRSGRRHKPRDDLLAPHSMTSSASRRTEVGTVTPSASAVFRLTTSWKRAGRSMGCSAASAPSRILRVRAPAWRKSRVRSGP
jgi:hypothetical protein